MQLFRYQAEQNPVYKAFIQHLGVIPDKIRSIQSIPFLPISFFKTHELKTGRWETHTRFKSSGTTARTTSQHHLDELKFYLDHSVRCFEYFFGALRDYHFFALLPSYLERGESSLVAMMDHFIRGSESSHSGFYLHNLDTLLRDLERVKQSGKKTILWGVTYALLELAERYQPDLNHCMVFETGGMKGRRKEITRFELHERLRKGLNVSGIFSEYGMTELLSQCYTKGDNRFYCPPWIRIIGRDISDPLEKGLLNETAGINVIDLANVHSISFIETEDLGKAYSDHSFEVLGRLDNSDVRGCNLLVNG